MVFTRVKLLHNNLLKKLKHWNIFKVYHLYILDMFTLPGISKSWNHKLNPHFTPLKKQFLGK